MTPKRTLRIATQIKAAEPLPNAGINVILLPAAGSAVDKPAHPALGAIRNPAGEASVANRLLAALPHAEYRSVLPGLEPLTLKFGEVLHAPGVAIQHVYFPVDCVIALLASAGKDQALEVGMVGFDGMIGISLALGAKLSSVCAVVQVTGTAMRMNATCFHKAIRQCPALRRGLYRHADAKLALARQTVACNCFHAVEARLARWLLMTSDRVRSEEFFLTQALLADMLGVRRTTINVSAGPLQRRKLISYRRGRIRILDRKGLEAASCRCYARI